MGTSPQPTSPLIPKFVPAEISDIASASRTDGSRFSLVSYNILAQAYVKSAIFPHSPGHCLKWKARSQAILTVLKGLMADIFCLQMSMTPFTSQTWRNLVIQAPMLKEVDKSVMAVEFFIKPADSDGQERESDRGDPNDPSVRLKRDCVGIMAVFKLKDPPVHHVIIANTHLYWDPEWADVKLAQAEYLLARIQQFKQLVFSKLGCIPSVIVAGDFNSMPGDKVYHYLVCGASEVGPLPKNSEDQTVSLSSVYANTRGEPPFTNCTPEFTGTLDYILFSTFGNIRPVSFLELPEPVSPDVIGGLPNHYHPSDHLPIGAEFEVIE